MDTQRKKGVLDVCVLAALAGGPSYGYELVSRVSDCIPITESTLYPILRRLEAGGSLTTYRQEHSGRVRKYYQITDAGRQRMEDFLTEWEEMQRIYQFVKNQQFQNQAPKPEEQEASI